MSIALADGSPVPSPPPVLHSITVQAAPLPATPAPSSDEALPPAVTAALIGWIIAAVGAAALLRVFRRRSILGPIRLAPAHSAFALLFDLFAGLAVMFITLMLASRAGARNFPALVLWNVVGELAGWALILWLIRRENASRQMGVAFGQIGRGLLIGCAAMIIVFPIVVGTSEATAALLKWLGKPPPAPHQVLESLGDTKDRRVIAVDVAAAVIAAPLAEELAFRGLLQTILGRVFDRLLRRRGGGGGDRSPAARWLAVLFTAACFAAVHGVPAFFPPLFVLAVGLGYTYERTANLWCSVTMHALFNAAMIAVFLSPLNR